MSRCKRLVGAKGKGQLLQDLSEFIGLSARPRAPRERRADPRAGGRGDAVRDLQHRLVGARVTSVAPAEFGSFGADDRGRGPRVPERRAGSRVDGIVGPETWSALVESGFVLGDRLLYLRRPILRGDDVAALQHRLNRLGFDAGREDGILGPETATRAARVPAQRRA